MVLARCESTCDWTRSDLFSVLPLRQFKDGRARTPLLSRHRQYGRCSGSVVRSRELVSARLVVYQVRSTSRKCCAVPFPVVRRRWAASWLRSLMGDRIPTRKRNPSFPYLGSGAYSFCFCFGAGFRAVGARWSVRRAFLIFLSMAAFSSSTKILVPSAIVRRAFGQKIGFEFNYLSNILHLDGKFDHIIFKLWLTLFHFFHAREVMSRGANCVQI